MIELVGISNSVTVLEDMMETFDEEHGFFLLLGAAPADLEAAVQKEHMVDALILDSNLAWEARHLFPLLRNMTRLLVLVIHDDGEESCRKAAEAAASVESHGVSVHLIRHPWDPEAARMTVRETIAGLEECSPAGAVRGDDGGSTDEDGRTAGPPRDEDPFLSCRGDTNDGPRCNREGSPHDRTRWEKEVRRGEKSSPRRRRLPRAEHPGRSRGTPPKSYAA